MNPQYDDLTIERVIRASRRAVWDAWTTPAAFAQWWIPDPYLCRVDHFAPHAGGGFITSMSEDGSHFSPHMDAAFLVVDQCSGQHPASDDSGTGGRDRRGGSAGPSGRHDIPDHRAPRGRGGARRT